MLNLLRCIFIFFIIIGCQQRERKIQKRDIIKIENKFSSEQNDNSFILQMAKDSMYNYLISIDQKKLTINCINLMRYIKSRNTNSNLHHKEKVKFITVLLELYCSDKVSRETISKLMDGYFLSGEVRALIIQEFTDCNKNKSCKSICHQLNQVSFKAFNF